jgi:hypothetical protein
MSCFALSLPACRQHSPPTASHVLLQLGRSFSGNLSQLGRSLSGQLPQLPRASSVASAARPPSYLGFAAPATPANVPGGSSSGIPRAPSRLSQLLAEGGGAGAAKLRQQQGSAGQAAGVEVEEPDAQQQGQPGSGAGPSATAAAAAAVHQWLEAARDEEVEAEEGQRHGGEAAHALINQGLVHHCQGAAGSSADAPAATAEQQPGASEAVLGASSSSSQAAAAAAGAAAGGSEVPEAEAAAAAKKKKKKKQRKSLKEGDVGGGGGGGPGGGASTSAGAAVAGAGLALVALAALAAGQQGGGAAAGEVALPTRAPLAGARLPHGCMAAADAALPVCLRPPPAACLHLSSQTGFSLKMAHSSVPYFHPAGHCPCPHAPGGLAAALIDGGGGSSSSSSGAGSGGGHFLGLSLPQWGEALGWAMTAVYAGACVRGRHAAAAGQRAAAGRPGLVLQYLSPSSCSSPGIELLRGVPS